MPEITAQVGPTLRGLTRELDIIAHNLANVNTAGYKRRVNDFTKALMTQSGSASADGTESVALQTALDFTQGNLIETGRSLDMALYGSGFFVIETPQGPLYTRSGAFRVNPNGQLVDLAGRTVAGDAGPLTLPPTVDLTQITIAGDGRIMTADGPIGKFKLVDFQEQQNKLVPVGLNCYQAPVDITAVTAGNVVVKQGFQEGSNVQMVEELVDMIMVSRLYEANMKSISKNSEASKSLLDVAMSG
jgi:flagellar basal-body rod protein FlgF